MVRNETMLLKKRKILNDFRKTVCFTYLNSPILSAVRGMPYYGPYFNNVKRIPPWHYTQRTVYPNRKHDPIREDLGKAATKSSIYVPDTATLWFQRQRIITMVTDYMNKLEPKEALAFQYELCKCTPRTYSVPPKQCFRLKRAAHMVDTLNKCPTSVQTKRMSPEFLKLLKDYDCRICQQLLSAAYNAPLQMKGVNDYEKLPINIKDSLEKLRQQREKRQSKKCFCELCRCSGLDSTIGEDLPTKEKVELIKPRDTVKIVISRPSVQGPRLRNQFLHIHDNSYAKLSDKAQSKKKTRTSSKNLEQSRSEVEIKKSDSAIMNKEQKPLRQIWTKPDAIRIRDSSTSLDRSIVIKSKRPQQATRRKKLKNITSESYRTNKSMKSRVSIRDFLEKILPSTQKKENRKERKQIKAIKLKRKILKNPHKDYVLGQHDNKNSLHDLNDSRSSTKIKQTNKLPKKPKKLLKAKSSKTYENAPVPFRDIVQELKERKKTSKKQPIKSSASFSISNALVPVGETPKPSQVQNQTSSKGKQQTHKINAYYLASHQAPKPSSHFELKIEQKSPSPSHKQQHNQSYSEHHSAKGQNLNKHKIHKGPRIKHPLDNKVIQNRQISRVQRYKLQNLTNPIHLGLVVHIPKKRTINSLSSNINVLVETEKMVEDENNVEDKSEMSQSTLKQKAKRTINLNMLFPLKEIQPQPIKHDEKCVIKYKGRRSKNKCGSDKLKSIQLKTDEAIKSIGTLEQINVEERLSLTLGTSIPSNRDESIKKRKNVSELDKDHLNTNNDDIKRQVRGGKVTKSKKKLQKHAKSVVNEPLDQVEKDSNSFIENYDTYFYDDHIMTENDDESKCFQYEGASCENIESESLNKEKRTALIDFIKPRESKPKPWKAYNVTPPCSRNIKRKRYFTSCRYEDLWAVTRFSKANRQQSNWHKRKEVFQQQQQQNYVECEKKYQIHRALKNCNNILRNICFKEQFDDGKNLTIKDPERYEMVAKRTQYDLNGWKKRQNIFQIYSEAIRNNSALTA